MIDYKKYMFMWMFVSIFMIGGVLNLYAVTENSCKMPVKTDMNINGDRYFSYLYEEEVVVPELTDKFYIPDIYFSLGDILLLIGLIGSIVLAIDSTVLGVKTIHRWFKNDFDL